MAIAEGIARFVPGSRVDLRVDPVVRRPVDVISPEVELLARSFTLGLETKLFGRRITSTATIEHIVFRFPASFTTG